MVELSRLGPEPLHTRDDVPALNVRFVEVVTLTAIGAVNVMVELPKLIALTLELFERRDCAVTA